MPRTIEQHSIDEVRRLLVEGQSYRQIEKVTGVCKSVVGKIKQNPNARVARVSVAYSRVPEYYCDGCGSVVRVKPCVACGAREYQATNQKVQVETT